MSPRLDPRLEKAYERARRDAARQGVAMSIRSGFRTTERQEAMFACAIRLYGTREAARRWVAPPEESYHVKGRALDIQPRSAAAWLEQRQERYGLCRTFANEWWHFELNTSGKRCPAVISSAAARTP